MLSSRNAHCSRGSLLEGEEGEEDEGSRPRPNLILAMVGDGGSCLVVVGDVEVNAVGDIVGEVVGG